MWEILAWLAKVSILILLIGGIFFLAADNNQSLQRMALRMMGLAIAFAIVLTFVDLLLRVRQ
jgi:hypothetical protein